MLTSMLINVYTCNMNADQNTYFEPGINTCTCSSLRRTTRLVTQQYDAALRPAGLRATQFTILAVLTKSGQLRQTELAKLLGMEGTTLTRNLQPLLKKDWIRIDRDEDQRVRLISMTPAGNQIYAEAKPLWLQAQTQFVNAMGEAQWSALVEALESTAQIAEEP